MTPSGLDPFRDLPRPINPPGPPQIELQPDRSWLHDPEEPERVEIDAGIDERYVYDFDNGYSASVIRGPMSFGGRQGLWEIAVLHEGELTYDTPLGDVLGRLNDEEVARVLVEIAALPSRY